MIFVAMDGIVGGGISNRGFSIVDQFRLIDWGEPDKVRSGLKTRGVRNLDNLILPLFLRGEQEAGRLIMGDYQGILHISNGEEVSRFFKGIR